jgi:MFS family permease
MHKSLAPSVTLMTSWWYRHYVLGLLFLSYAVNVMDRSSVLAVTLQSIKAEFGASDTQLGLLTGIAFAVFFSTMGIPIAALADRSSRRNVLAASIAVWSGMTALCGMAVNFTMLFATRVGTAIGEAGGTPPSHSLISDYFPKSERGRAFAIFALGVPFGTALGTFIAGQALHAFGWRTTFMLVGLPGVLVAALVALTIKEPPRGLSDHSGTLRQTGSAPGVFEALAVLWQRPSFRHLCVASALHATVWYGSSAFNAAFLIRSHQMTAATAANWLTLFAMIGGLGTLLGGYLSDWLSVRTNDKRWYLWVPAFATLLMVPFHFIAYLSEGLSLALQSFAAMTFFAAAFFGPSITMTQALATLRMRSVASSVLLFVQTMIGYGLGPLLSGFISDELAPAYGIQSLRYALATIGVVNLWAALHYALGTRTLKEDLAHAEEQCQGSPVATAAAFDPVKA